MTKDEAVEQISKFFDRPRWVSAPDGSLALGSYAFGATIEPVYNTDTHQVRFYTVRVGRSIGWGQDPGELLAKVEFDTLEEAKNFGMLIYTQNKPDTIDRTRVRGYPI